MTSTHRGSSRGNKARVRVVLAAALGLAVIVGGVLLLRGEASDPEGSDQSASAPSSGQRTDSAGGTGTTPAAPDPDADSTPLAASTEAITTPTDLEELVLRGADLPPGWRTVAEVAPAARRVVGNCIRTALTTRVPHVERTEPFRQGADGAILASTLHSFPTPAAGSEGYRTIAKSLARCPQTSTRALTISLGESAVSADGATALDLSFRKGDATARGQVILARSGRFVVSTIAVGATSDDIAVARSAMNAVLSRVS